MKRGDTLKFTRAGLAYLGPTTVGGKEALEKRRFEYRCQARRDKDCISVVRVGSSTYTVLHKSFLEPA